MNLKAEVLVGDNRKIVKTLAPQSVQCCVTSPPYWGLRDYGADQQIGLEKSPTDFIEQLCLVFDGVWDVLKDDGTLWVNLGDSYAGNNSRASNNGRAGYGTKREGIFTKTGDGLKNKDLVGIPWMFAFAMRDRGWYLRQDIIWAKPNPMPESVTDRCTKSHEYIFLFTKSNRYFYNHNAIKEDALTAPQSRDKKGEGYQADYANGERVFGTDGKRNKRDVWTVATKPFKGAHFACYPPALIEPCILAGSKEGDSILDPFSGSGTTGEVALLNSRNFIGLEVNPDYAEISRNRLLDSVGLFGEIIINDGVVS